MTFYQTDISLSDWLQYKFIYKEKIKPGVDLLQLQEEVILSLSVPWRHLHKSYIILLLSSETKVKDLHI